jgi:hypothetical protein
MMTRAARSAMLAQPHLRPRLLQARIYEILHPGQQPLPGVAAMPVVTFSAVADLRAALAGQRLPPSTGGILYDVEAWSFTPAAAIAASHLLVDDYWLNIPGTRPRCPACNPPRPDIGAEVLSGAP